MSPAAWFSVDAVSSCVGTAEGAMQHGRSCRSPCCCMGTRAVGSWLGQPRSKPLSQRSMKRNHQPDEGTGDCFSSSAAHMVNVDWNLRNKTSSSPLRSHCCFPRQRVWVAAQVSSISRSRSLAKGCHIYTDSKGWSNGSPQNNICLLATLQTTYLQYS